MPGRKCCKISHNNGLTCASPPVTPERCAITTAAFYLHSQDSDGRHVHGGWSVG